MPERGEREEKEEKKERNKNPQGRDPKTSQEKKKKKSRGDKVTNKVGRHSISLPSFISLTSLQKGHAGDNGV